MSTRHARKARFAGISGFAIAVAVPNLTYAGNDANFVLYNHHTEARGETEVNLYNDFARVGREGEPDYAAQLLEIEYGVTDTWTTALHLEGVKLDGEGYAFGSLRLESRLRLFGEATLLNPVLYVEYELEEPESRYIHAVTGRTDGEEEEQLEERTEHALESRLIVGRDVTKRLNLAFNWINELDFYTGDWKFGYAAGLNSVVQRADDGHIEFGHRNFGGWNIEKLTLGAELYGGLGDTQLGLTLAPEDTQHYAGINLRGDLENHFHFILGGAFGLTADSEDALLRLSAGYEFEAE